MPTLQESSTGPVVSSLQTLLTNGASGQWNTTPQGIDGNFGPHTKASVVAFQTWGGVAQDGIVGDQTWAVSLHAASATLATAVGLQFRDRLIRRGERASKQVRGRPLDNPLVCANLWRRGRL
jgi:hypothetical protein